MRQFVKYVLATITGIFLMMVVFGIFIFSVATGLASSVNKKVAMPDNTILELEIKNMIVDNSSDDPFQYFIAGGQDLSSTSVSKIRNTLRQAKGDDKVKGVFLKIGPFDGGFASLQEIRQSISDFKTSGKFVYAHADYLDEKGFYLASAADSLFMNPAGDFFLNGFSSNIIYFKEALDKMGVKMQAIRVGEYKGAVEPYVTNTMSEENKSQIQAYIDELYSIFITEAAQGIDMPAKELRAMADNFTIKSVDDAVDKGLVNATLFIDEVKAQFAKRSGLDQDELKFVSYKRYHAPFNKDVEIEKDKRIALIYADGEIGMGKGVYGSIGSEGLSETLRKVRNDKSISAVVLRINSPGGSSLASDIIWREVKLTQETKPVIVSMGDVAASGGYYIAVAADTIVAQPSTVTGSIGVFLIMPNAQELMEDKLGLHTQTVKTGPYADFGSIDRPLKEEERGFLQGYADRVYSDFITKVAEGRSMAKDSVDKIAKGRVWVATQAKELNLVDVLGNLDTAIQIAKWKAGITKKVRLDIYPKPQNPIEMLMNYKGQIKTNALKEELGPIYGFWKMLSQYASSESKGVNVQMRLPFELQLN